MDSSLQNLNKIIAAACGISEKDLAAYIAAKQQQARIKAAKQNARHAAAMEQMTDVQAVLIDRLCADGHILQDRIWQNRTTGKIALVLHKKCWDGAKGRMGCKLVVVYPDGSRGQTFEKRISIKAGF